MPPSSPVGNLTARRDFTDVRDVVPPTGWWPRRQARGRSSTWPPGSMWPWPRSSAELEQLAGVELSHVVDEALLRPADIPVLRGDASKLTRLTGWRPEIPLGRSLADVLDQFVG